MKKSRIKPILFIIFSIFIFIGCTVTPEMDVKDEETPAIISIDAPVITSVKSDNKNKTITVTWNPIETADYYVFSYQSASDYLSGFEMKNDIISVNSVSGSNQYTIPASILDNPSDMRMIFRVKAGKLGSSSSRRLESEYSERKEGVIIDSFKVSRYITNNNLTFFYSYPKTQSVISDGSIADVAVDFYRMPDDFNESEPIDSIELGEPSEPFDIELKSAEKVNYIAVLKVDGEEVNRKLVSVSNSVIETPDHLISLSAENNLSTGIKLSWKYPAINTGIDPLNATIKFKIERRKVGLSDWENVKDESNSEVLLSASDSSVADSMEYLDKTAEANADYEYRVTTYYYITQEDGSEIIYRESPQNQKRIEKAYRHDTKPLSFTVEKAEDYQNPYKVKLTWKFLHDISENAEVSFVRYSFDYGTPENAIAIEKQAEDDEFSLTDTISLSEEENKKKHSYFYELKLSLDANEFSTRAKFADGKDGVIETIPSVKEIDFISGVPEASTSLANKVNVSFRINTSDIDKINSELSEDEKIKYENIYVQLKRLNDDGIFENKYEGKGISIFDGTNIANTISDSSDFIPGKEYSYRIYINYDDSSSPYSGIYSIGDSFLGRTMDSVSEIHASDINYSAVKTEIRWEPVDVAAGYNIVFKKYGDDSVYKSIPVGNVTFYTISEQIEKGIKYNVYIEALDELGGKVISSTFATTAIVHPIDPIIETGADYIDLKWAPLDNVTDYKVYVYGSNSKSEENLISSFNFNTIKIDSKDENLACRVYAKNLVASEKNTAEYPLSKDYYFVIVPQVMAKDFVIDSADVVLKAGCWVKPPKNIKATKGEYRDMIVVTWCDPDCPDHCDGSCGDTSETGLSYKVFRREIPSGSWVEIGDSYTKKFEDYDADGEFEYTVCSVAGSLEGPIQDKFKSIDNIYTNYGCNLMAPLSFVANDFSTTGNEKFLITFNEAPYAIGYKLTINGKDFSIYPDNTDNNSPEISDFKVILNEDKSETVSFYIPRVDVTESVLVSADIHSENFQGKKSFNANSRFKVNYLKNYEIVNIANYCLNSVYFLADSYFSHDWWGGTLPFEDDSKSYNNSAKTVTISSSFGASQTPGNSIFDKYKIGAYEINNIGIFNNTAIDGNEWDKKGYLGVDPLDTVNGAITIEIPYGFGLKKVKYENYGVKNGKGSVFVYPDYVDEENTGESKHITDLTTIKTSIL